MCQNIDETTTLRIPVNVTGLDVIAAAPCPAVSSSQKAGGAPASYRDRGKKSLKRPFQSSNQGAQFRPPIKAGNVAP